MAHLFRAVVIIVDDQGALFQEPEVRHPDDGGIVEENFRDRVVSQYSVLLFSPGDDAHRIATPVRGNVSSEF